MARRSRFGDHRRAIAAEGDAAEKLRPRLKGKDIEAQFSGIAAKYAGDCVKCCGPYYPGDRVVRSRGGRYAHVQCMSGWDDE